MKVFSNMLLSLTKIKTKNNSKVRTVRQSSSEQATQRKTG